MPHILKRFNKLIKPVSLMLIICAVCNAAAIYSVSAADTVSGTDADMTANVDDGTDADSGYNPGSYELPVIPEPPIYISFDDTTLMKDNSYRGFYPVRRLFLYDDKAMIDIELPKNAYSDDAISGKSLYFDGSFGLKFPDSISSDSYTFGYWIKPDAVESYVPTLMILKSVFSADEFLSLTLNADGKSPNLWSHIMNPDDIRHSTGIPNGLVEDEWIYVTISVDETSDSSSYKVHPDDHHARAVLYLNGYYIDEGLVPRELLNGTPYKMWFGINIWDNLYRGYLDEFVMYYEFFDETRAKALFVQNGGTFNAKNPVNNEASDGKTVGSVFNKPYDWNILTPNLTTLDEHFLLNAFISADAGKDESNDAVKPHAGIFLPANSHNTISVYYCIGGSLLLLGAVLLIAVYKKSKSAY